MKTILNAHSSAHGRWARFGPYYATFPIDFVETNILAHTKVGDAILDPYSGRFSSVYIGAALGRQGTGIEINPVGWLYGKAKTCPVNKNTLLTRLKEVEAESVKYDLISEEMDEFYKMCFCKSVLKFLLASKEMLKWKESDVDAMLMAFILVNLHGKINDSLSNSMQITKSMGLSYSIQWWKKKGMNIPPEINPVNLLLKKIDWRYKFGIPFLSESKIILGDSTEELPKLGLQSKELKKYSLLITSPPYCNVTDYHVDQWLRLWMLNIGDISKTKNTGRFTNKEDYKTMLFDVFSNCAPLMAKKSTIIVRTDSRKFTLNATIDVLKKIYFDYKIKIIDSPIKMGKRTQTEVFNNSSSSSGEVDIILKRNC